MAIVVEWVKNRLDSCTSISPTWGQRVQASQKYGFPIENGIPTYPPERKWVSNERQRSYLDGYQLYTLPGLLGTIFSYLELEDDYSNGIRQLSDIAKTSIKLSQRSSATTLEQNDSIEIGQGFIGRQPKFILNDGTQRDITANMIALSEYAFGTKRHKTRQVFSESIRGILHLYPIESAADQNTFAEMHIRAFNLPGLGEDMDNVMTLNRQR